MLRAAGTLTLDLAQQLLSEGLGLKDATPYKVLFRGPEPVFADLVSFERRDPHNPTRPICAVRAHVSDAGLLSNKYYGLGSGPGVHEPSRRPGAEEVYRWPGPFERLHPAFSR